MTFNHNPKFLDAYDSTDTLAKGIDEYYAPVPSTRVNHDPVNNPSHYASGAVECIDAIESSMSEFAFEGYLKGNIMKYLWRYEKKVNPTEDLKKARWYLDKLITRVEAATQ